MSTAAFVAVLFVAVLHAYFMYLEMVAWTTPKGRKTFNLTPEFAEASKVLAANQGLYNGFLVAGLVWGLIASRSDTMRPDGFAIECFFLMCVIVAGVFGAITSSRRILYFQALPGAVALVLVALAHGG